MSVVLAQPALVSSETYVIGYRNCGHCKTVSLEEYFNAACAVPDHYHEEIKTSAGTVWRLTYPNADCTTCSAAERDYWYYNVGDPPEPKDRWSSNYGWYWQVYRERLGLAYDMLASAERILGRKVSLSDLFALVGQKGWVRASDYGCSGTLVHWSDDATIKELRPPRRSPVYYDDSDAVHHYVTEPVFDLSGSGLCYTRRLSEIKLIEASN